MKNLRGLVTRAMLMVFLGSAFLWISSLFAQQPQISDMLQRYGSSSAVGEYEGTLYCIRCSLSPTPQNIAACNQEGHAHFLLMKDGHAHPLYGINKAIADKINAEELHEKQVKIRGRYFPVANAILVGDVQPLGR